MAVTTRQLFIDGARQGRISGTTDWEGQSYTITGSGTHSLKWRYTKDGYGTGGSDCAWVDYVQSPTPTDWLTITYGYDSAGRRIEKAYDGQTVMKYLYDGGQIIAEYDGNDNLLHKYIYGPGIDQPICMIDVEHSNATYYYHFDGLGSVIALTNGAGSVVNLYEYSVFGEVSASDPNHPNRFLFTGREFDKDTGLYYYRARYYNPYIGRFLQSDPARSGMNWYSYCGNGPIGYTDPYGLRKGWRWSWPTIPEPGCDGKKVWREYHPFGYPEPTGDFIPPLWIAPPVDGKTWTPGNFWWWYKYGDGEPVWLNDTGLLPAFRANALVRVCRAELLAVARAMADAMYDTLMDGWAAWKAAGDPTATFPISESTVVRMSVRSPSSYNFFPGGWFSKALELLDPLSVFGGGYLYADIAVTVQVASDGAGYGFIDYQFRIHDWFKDVYDGFNKIPDPSSTVPDSGGWWWEFDDGYPYMLEGWWPEYDDKEYPGGSWINHK